MHFLINKLKQLMQLSKGY